jgi:hypothetical protein
MGISGWTAGAFTFVGLAGSALMTLSLRALVYEEATLWGASLGLVTIWACLHLLASRSRFWATVAVLAAALSMSARPTVGIGAVAVVVVVALLRRNWLLLATGPAAAFALYATFMLWKFGALYPPNEHQLDCIQSAKCLALSSGGSTQPKYVLTNLYQYLRPDHLQFVDRFPWIKAPRPRDARITLIGIHKYLGTDAMSSVTTTMPALLALALVGLVTTNWARRWLVLASCTGPLVTCMYYGATQRYLADFVPTLVLGSACGLAYLLSSAHWRTVARTAVVLLGTWSVLVCIALSLWKFNAG